MGICFEMNVQSLWLPNLFEPNIYCMLITDNTFMYKLVIHDLGKAILQDHGKNA